MKLRIPFLSTSTDSAIEKISTALAAMNHARAAEQQLHDALVAANERASELLGKIERAKDHRTLIQERMQRETDKDTGEIPASLLAALAVAEQECREWVKQRDQAVVEADRLHQAIRLHQAQPPSYPVCSSADGRAVVAALEETVATLERVNAAIAAETTRLSSFTVEDAAVVEARQALEDALADSIDVSVSAEVEAAQTRLSAVEARFAADQARSLESVETVRRTLAGLQRKRSALEAEQDRRSRLVDIAKRIFLETEILQVEAEYTLAVTTAFERLRTLAALGTIAQKGVFNTPANSATMPTVKGGSAEYRLGDLTAVVQQIRARFAAQGVAI
ncbi:MAG: hypothetical protein IPM11_01595 [Micropruina sp.]|nr:hypothetical protein [Micropruina sp.]